MLIFVERRIQRSIKSIMTNKCGLKHVKGDERRGQVVRHTCATRAPPDAKYITKTNKQKNQVMMKSSVIFLFKQNM